MSFLEASFNFGPRHKQQSNRTASITGFDYNQRWNDLDNRPGQLVCREQGKAALTRYSVLERSKGKTRIHFFPVTGRTHQLRVHAAHAEGLNSAILGDELYGTKGERLYLHAEVLEFHHPVSGERIRIEVAAEF